jgi:endonuclease YncB( thermonuclease family)
MEGYMTAFRVRSSIIAIFVSLTAALALQQGPSDPPKPFVGKVVSISDGDTVTVLLDRTQHKIRLEHIDAPESGQAFGTKAKKALGDLVFGKEVKVKWTGRDKTKRILGVIYVEDKNMNLELVKEGFAWHYTKYSKEPKYAEAQKAAKEAKSGLWADKTSGALGCRSSLVPLLPYYAGRDGRPSGTVREVQAALP